MRGVLDVAVVWHMHQPYYRVSDTDAYEMPWVRMHALKDYADMVDILTGHPGLRQTFNLVPSLVEQLRDYAEGRADDTYRTHTRTPAAELSPPERAFLLGIMCERATHPRAARNARYLELARKRDHATVDGAVRVEEFTDDEIRDLQVWFDLSWFDPVHLREGPLAELAARGRDFTEEDKTTVAEAEARLLARVLPTYRAAAEAGAVEITTSPYYHPILPLLMNSDLARVSMPGVELPTRRFAHPEDAGEHVRLALECHRSAFGRAPRGMWCSEQAVGEDVIGLLAGEGIAWTISDEAVLARSLDAQSRRPGGGGVDHPRLLHAPYHLEREDGVLDIVFRDRTLSDLIGFTYQTWDPGDAAGDLLHRLRRIREGLPDGPDGALVTIALDGENAWEYYRNDGRDFLERLYEGLDDEPALRCVTVSEHLRDHPPTRSLPWLHTGSWIGADFGTWMGDAAHRRAWDLLHDARDVVAGLRARAGSDDPGGAGPPDVELAWREILIAEGSDWFWWFSDHQESGMDHVWDAAFRRHLQQAYRLAGLTPPGALFAPVLPAAPAAGAGRVTPTIDGIVDPPHEWARAQALRPAGAGVMQRSTRLPIGDLRFGWDAEHLYFLVEPGRRGEDELEVVFYLATEAAADAAPHVQADESRPGAPPERPDGSPEPPGMADDTGADPRLLGFSPGWRLALPLSPPAGAHALEARLEPTAEAGSERPAGAPIHAFAGSVVEAAVPWTTLGAAGRRAVWVGAALFRGGSRIESFPSGGAVETAPAGV